MFSTAIDARRFAILFVASANGLIHYRKMEPTRLEGICFGKMFAGGVDCLMVISAPSPVIDLFHLESRRMATWRRSGANHA